MEEIWKSICDTEPACLAKFYGGTECKSMYPPPESERPMNRDHIDYHHCFMFRLDDYPGKYIKTELRIALEDCSEIKLCGGASEKPSVELDESLKSYDKIYPEPIKNKVQLQKFIKKLYDENEKDYDLEPVLLYLKKVKKEGR